MGKNPAQKAKEVEAKKKTTAKEEKTAHATTPKKKKVAVAAATKTERSCQVKACKRAYRAKGYCNTHYKKWRRGEYGKARFKTCKDFECFKPMSLNRHGYCEEHFQNYYVKGMQVHKAPAAAAPTKEEKVAANG